jgi:hypothetical protein
MESQGSPTNPSLTGEQLSGCSRHCCCRASNAAASLLSCKQCRCCWQLCGTLVLMSGVSCLADLTYSSNGCSKPACRITEWHDRCESYPLAGHSPLIQVVAARRWLLYTSEWLCFRILHPFNHPLKLDQVAASAQLACRTVQPTLCVALNCVTVHNDPV